MELYSTAAAAAALGLTVDGMKYHLKQRNIAGAKIGKTLVFTDRDLRAFQRRRRPAGRPRSTRRVA